MEREKIITLIDMYRRILSKPYSWIIIFIYIVGIITYLVYPNIGKGQLSEVESLKLRLKNTQLELDNNKQLIYELSDKDRRFGFLRKIEIRDEKITGQQKAEVSRLIEYAEFALGKEDFKYAEQFYNEANNSVETSIGHYYLGRLFYIQGITEKAEIEWMKAIKLDENFRYPELRFFISILLYELGKDKDSKEYLEQYLK